MPYDTTPVADRHLLDGVARREADALRALYQRHGESLYALAYGMLVDPGDAEEVVSETFAHLWRTAARFVATTNQSVSACLKAIARSRARGRHPAPPCRSRAWGRPHRPRQARHAGGAGAQGRSVGQSSTLAGRELTQFS